MAVACSAPADPPYGPTDGPPRLSEVRLSGVRVGEQRTWWSEEADGVRIRQVTEWRVRLQGEDLAWTTALAVRVDPEGVLRDGAFSRDTASTTWAAEGPVHILEASAPALRRAAGGETVSLDAWRPASGEVVVARLGPAPGGVFVDAGGARETWAIDADGRVRGVRAGAIEVVEVDAFAPADVPDLAALLRLPTERWTDAVHARHLVVRLDGVAPDDLHFPPWQVASPEGVTVDRPLWHEIPAKAPPVPDGLSEWLGPSPGIEVGTPALVAEVAGVVEGHDDARDRLGFLVQHVQRRVRAVARPGPPEATRALATGKGDCNEYAAVLVALLRTAGVPARPVTGWVYADEVVEPGLYPHAWVEAWMGEPVGWVPVDPAYGQVIADATHVRARDGIAAVARPVVTRAEMR